MKISKSAYLQSFIATTISLALVRCVFPSVAGNMDENSAITSKQTSIDSTTKDSANNDLIDNQVNSFVAHSIKSRFFASDGSLTKNKIWSVPGFQNTFPDQNDVQLVSAKNGE